MLCGYRYSPKTRASDIENLCMIFETESKQQLAGCKKISRNMSVVSCLFFWCRCVMMWVQMPGHSAEEEVTADNYEDYINDYTKKVSQ